MNVQITHNSRPSLFWSGIVMFGGAFFLLSAALIENQLHDFDRYFTQKIQSWRTPFWTTIMSTVTFLGSGITRIIFFLGTTFILVRRKLTQENILLFLAFVMGPLLTGFLKNLFERPRPSENALLLLNSYSFPSGHALCSLLFFGMMGYCFTKIVTQNWQKITILLLSVVLSIAIGVSRVYLGVHYPSDVIAGFAASSVVLIFLLRSYFYQPTSAYTIVRKFHT
ncbi:phosphatase PAP2 family protein [Risungbinella massiliensis]|uniref:phosphatase PAP2 family protein n=1 Tax=Risungbinella massiliensis TaxID=1329796 RepID=UPI00069A401B|nr:phosphatase PAP2 family protein [Risungbinella massiliensis]